MENFWKGQPADMRDKDEQIQANSIEEQAKELLGYDRESLIRDMDEAEQEWEKQKRNDPGLESRTKQEAKFGFEKLMAKARAEEKILENRTVEYRSIVMEDHKRRFRLKRYGKVLLVAAVLMMLLSGLGISSVANKKFALQKLDSEARKNEVLWNDNSYRVENGDLESAYKKIAEEFKIKPLVLNYKPVGMAYHSLLNDDNGVDLVFLYKENYIHFLQAKYDAQKVSEAVISDRGGEILIENPFLDHVFSVTENVLENDIIEYSTTWEDQNALYYFSGIMEKDEFIKIIEELTYYN